MIKEERCLIAKKYRQQGLFCGQCLLLAFRDITGLNEEQSVSIGSALSSGMGYGGLCGCVASAGVILGLRYPHVVENGVEGKKQTLKLTREFRHRFQDQFGALNCRELLAAEGLQGTPYAKQLDDGDHCGLMIVSAVELLHDYLGELEKE